MSGSGGFRILDPTYEPFTRGLAAAQAKTAARSPLSLDGLRIGLLANGKSNSRELLEELRDELGARAGVRILSSLALTKSSFSVPPTAGDFARLVKEADLVLTALGD